MLYFTCFLAEENGDDIVLGLSGWDIVEALVNLRNFVRILVHTGYIYFVYVLFFEGVLDNLTLLNGIRMKSPCLE